MPRVKDHGDTRAHLPSNKVGEVLDPLVYLLHPRRTTMDSIRRTFISPIQPLSEISTW